MTWTLIIMGTLAIVCTINRLRTWIAFSLAIMMQFATDPTFHGVTGFFQVWFSFAIVGAIILMIQRNPGTFAKGLALFGIGFMVGNKGINPTKWFD